VTICPRASAPRRRPAPPPRGDYWGSTMSTAALQRAPDRVGVVLENSRKSRATVFGYRQVPADVEDALRKQAVRIREKNRALALTAIEIGWDLFAVQQHLNRQFIGWVIGRSTLWSASQADRPSSDQHKSVPGKKVMPKNRVPSGIMAAR
jgi:hypothetical protein